MTDSEDIYNILQMRTDDDVSDEVGKIVLRIFPEADISPIRAAFLTVADLYAGCYPGYKACNTYYHDFCHIRDTFLAISRLIHGAALDRELFSEQAVNIALIAALFHDSGYIQEESDHEGSGGKYTKIHVPRSMDFFERYAGEKGFKDEDIDNGRDMILCTDLSMNISEIRFASPESELLGRMLNMADLLAQMSDRVYLEKLMFLYHEFREGLVEGYVSEEDLLRKSLGFFDFVLGYIEKVLNKTNYYMSLHFRCRWGIDRNPYHDAIKKHKNYLQKIMKLPDDKLFGKLKRAGIAEKVQMLYHQKIGNSGKPSEDDNG